MEVEGGADRGATALGGRCVLKGHPGVSRQPSVVVDRVEDVPEEQLRGPHSPPPEPNLIAEAVAHAHERGHVVEVLQAAIAELVNEPVAGERLP